MKAFLFCLHHAMPTAMLMTEEGNVIRAHGGFDIKDAKYWFNYFKKGEGYDVEEIPQDIIDKFFYEKGNTTDILPDGFRQAMELNQKMAKTE